MRLPQGAHIGSGVAMSEYRRIPKPRDADTWRWDIPPGNQGQAVTVAYTNGQPRGRWQAHEAVEGAKYKRVCDAADGSTDYYARVGSAYWKDLVSP